MEKITMDQAIEIYNINKTFGKTKALKGINLNIKKGEIVSLIGASGSGKSTLLRHISGLIKSDKKNSYINVLGKKIQSNGSLSKDIRKIRSHIGFIFQQFNLVDRLSLLKNVLVGNLARMPFWRSWLQIFKKNEKLEAMKALRRVKMMHHATQRASTLSGGQQQRAAIARAIVQQAEIVLADEPIASLDPESSKRVMKLLKKLNKKDEVTVIVSLHQVDYAIKYCKRIIALKDGEVFYDGNAEDLTTKKLQDIYGSQFSELGMSDDDFDDDHDNYLEEHISKDKYAEVKAML
jgi:phosphonate transport system ATP-binding protein